MIEISLFQSLQLEFNGDDIQRYTSIMAKLYKSQKKAGFGNRDLDKDEFAWLDKFVTKLAQGTLNKYLDAT